MSTALADSIDELLPQTQCTKCGYPSCRRYAEALASGEADINQCPPGGEQGIHRLAALLRREPKPLDPSHGIEHERHVALIDEPICIGCTLCIQACPVDAIVGAPKQMHTVITALCTGCDLCVAPCPVDCIRMVPATGEDAAWERTRADAARRRFQLRDARLAREQAERAQRLAQRSLAARSEEPAATDPKRAAILAAIERAKAKRAAAAPRNTDGLPPEIRARIAEIDVRRAAAKKFKE